MSRILSPEVSDRAVHLLAACCLSFDPPLRFEIRRLCIRAPLPAFTTAGLRSSGTLRLPTMAAMSRE